MLTQAWDSSADCTVALLQHYIFDLGGYSPRELVANWLRGYPANWVRLAVIEALYQGRYKAVSVEQILTFWQRRDQVLPHFNCEFERLVCGNVEPRLTRQSDRDRAANPHPPVLKSSVHLSNDAHRSARAKSESNSSQPPSAQIVDITAKVVPGNKQMHAGASHNRQLYPSNNPRAHTRPLPLALASSVSQQPIRQFNPETTQASDFYTKLKAISQHG